MALELINSRNEKFCSGTNCKVISLYNTVRNFGVVQSMKNKIGETIKVQPTYEKYCGSYGVRIWKTYQDSFLLHVDDLSTDIDRVVDYSTIKPLFKWLTLNPGNYMKQYKNYYCFFKSLTDEPPPKNWALDDTKYGKNYRIMQVNQKGCYGGFVNTYRSFRYSYKTHPTHTLHKVYLPVKNKIRLINFPTLLQLKEAMEHFKRGRMIPKQWDLDEIFDEKAVFKVPIYPSIEFAIDLRKITKERWYWYACMIRYLGENPRLLHAFNGLLRDINTLHPIIALILTAASYATATNAAVECKGLVHCNSVTKKIFVEKKKIAEFATRVAKFLTKMQFTGGKLLKNEGVDFPMWKIFKLFRDQLVVRRCYIGPDPSDYTTKRFYDKTSIGVRVPKESYESLEHLLGYNPFTRKVTKYEG